MKKTLSILLSFFILVSTIPPSAFWEETLEMGLPEVISDQNPKEDFWNIENSDIIDENLFFDDMITIGWQSWQDLDQNFNPGVSWWNIGLTWDYTFLQWQSWQDSEFVFVDESDDITLDYDFPELRSLDSDPELIISEVFSYWQDEWVEIYNSSENDFLWTISLSWAKASIVNLSNIFIPWNKAIIVGDNMTMISNHNIVVVSTLSLNMYDTKQIDIKLIYSWEIIDNFFVDTWTILDLNNKKKSFQKFIDTKNIFPSQNYQNYNISDWFTANPWMVYSEGIWDRPSLKLTEIYFDGNENWFEVTNLWFSDFSGEIYLSWNLNFSIPTNIAVGTSKVFANNIYSMFQTGIDVQIIPNLIKFENQKISLDLIWSGQILDNFFVHQTQVEHYQGFETSFEKIWEWQVWTTTVVWLNTDRYYNTNRWIAANPTKYFATWENLIDVTSSRTPPVQEWDLPIDCDDYRENSTLYISETYFGAWIYPSYVEINVLDDIKDYYPQIKLSGSALWQEVFFNTTDMRKNTKVLLSNSEVWYDEWRESVSNSNFSLNDSWRIIVYGKVSWSTWYILDIIYLNWWSSWRSLYMWTNSIQCAGIFDYHDKFSPWLSIWQSQFIQITPEPIVQYITVWWWGASQNNEEKWFNTHENTNWEIQISSMKYFGDLQILKLKSKSNSDINLRDYQIQWFDWEIRSIKWNTLFAKQNMAFVWNYGFPTKTDHCINILKDGNVIDRYCRNSLSKANSKDEENIQNQLEFWIDEDFDENLEEDTLQEDLLTWNIANNKNIKIIDLDYDPPWADKDKETITLFLLTWNQIDLSKYTLQYIKDGNIFNKKINGTLTFGSQQVFKWDYGLPNTTQDKKPVIVNLLDPDKNIVDTYSYNPNKIKEIPNWEYKVLSVIDWDTIKISYLNQEFNIRFAGIDAPESSALRCGKVECFGVEAKTYLGSLLTNKTISFESESVDDFDRFVWYVFLNWENINQKLIKNGYAREYSYKNKSYKYQPEFKSAQNYAQNNLLWLRWSKCNWQRLCPVEETKVKENYILNIDHVLYDPEWNDTWQEEITISMIKWFALNFVDWFYIMINDTKKSLKNYWAMSEWETKILKWTFWFPNTKKTTILLMNGDINLATYFYDPDLDKLLEEKILTGEQIISGINLSIISITPNPIWKDSLWEEIWILYSWLEKKLDLSSWYYIKIWNTKKYLKWELVSNQETLLTWNFGFPNKAACVEVGYKKIIFDKFCYPQSKEGQKFYISNWVLENISDIDFNILKTAKLQNIWNKICLTYWWQQFYCKNMPYSKLSTKKVNQNKLYKEYFDVFENHLKNQRKVMYYNSDIKNYFNLLNEIEKTISKWESSFDLDGHFYQTYEFKKMYEDKYPTTTSVALKEKIFEFIPDPIMSKYEKLKKEYEDYLMNSS